MNNFFTYLGFPFVVNALICGVLISLCASLLGTTLVLKRYSFIGDGLSHVAFGALAIATVLRISGKMIIVLPITIICAVLLLCGGKSKKISGDASIGMLSVTALAVGYLLLNIFPPKTGNIAGDVCSTLFGSSLILSLTKFDVIAAIVLSVATILFFILFYNKIFAVTFDESFAKATGTRTDFLNVIMAIIIAVVIVLAMNLVGSLLISALVIFPAITAMRLFKSFRAVTITSAILAVSCSLIGLIVSIIFSTPVGATIVAIQAVLFIIFSIINFCTNT